MTDVIGFLCLIPFTRQRFADMVLSKVTVINPAQGFHHHAGPGISIRRIPAIPVIHLLFTRAM
ncbi:hypothetical protein [Aliamphritea spongicola]|nr:hypothetical protein [Aliamphritea spongicola]